MSGVFYRVLANLRAFLEKIYFSHKLSGGTSSWMLSDDIFYEGFRYCYSEHIGDLFVYSDLFRSGGLYWEILYRPAVQKDSYRHLGSVASAFAIIDSAGGEGSAFYQEAVTDY